MPRETSFAPAAVTQPGHRRRCRDRSDAERLELSIEPPEACPSGRLRSQDLIYSAWPLLVEVGVRAAAIRDMNASAPLIAGDVGLVMPRTARVLAAPVAFGVPWSMGVLGHPVRLSARLFLGPRSGGRRTEMRERSARAGGRCRRVLWLGWGRARLRR